MKKIFFYWFAFLVFLLPCNNLYAQTPKLNNAFYFPYGIVVDSKGNAFVTGQNHQVIKITPAGKAELFAGGGRYYKDGKGKDAGFGVTRGIAIDPEDNIYITDAKWIYKITPDGIVSTIAGIANAAEAKDGNRETASFLNLENIAIDNNQNLYVTDERFDAKKVSFHVIRKITPKGEVTTLKNSEGTVIQINYAGGIACDNLGNIIVCDQGSRCIKKISPDGMITTVAGKCDLQKWNPVFKEGSVSTATLVTPTGIVLNKNGEIFFSDSRMHRIIRVTNSKIITVAGNGEIDLSRSNIGGYAEEGYADGKAKLALFDGPKGLAFDKEGNLYIVDTNNSCIRKLSPGGLVTTFCKHF